LSLVLCVGACSFDPSGPAAVRDAAPPLFDADLDATDADAPDAIAPDAIAPDADPGLPDATPVPDADPNAPDATPVPDATPTPDAAPTPDGPPPSVVIRYNIGGGDHTGTDFPGFWAADPGTICTGTVEVRTGDIQQTVDDPLFLTRRWSGVTCGIVVPSGNYTVSLLFAEVFIDCPGGAAGGVGTRVFDVFAEGATIDTNIDIFAETGGCAFTMGGPLRKTYSVNVVDSLLSLILIPVSDDVTLNAIEIISQD